MRQRRLNKPAHGVNQRAAGQERVQAKRGGGDRPKPEGAGREVCGKRKVLAITVIKDERHEGLAMGMVACVAQQGV